MALLTYHSGRRGFLGFLTYLLGSDGVTRGGVIPAMTLTSSAGVETTLPTAAQIPASLGQKSAAASLSVVISADTYSLAAAATLASAATSSPISSIIGGVYVWAYQLSGTTPSLVLESLGPDGTTYQTIATVTASGAQPIMLGNNSTVRLRNSGANSITSLSSNLS